MLVRDVIRRARRHAGGDRDVLNRADAASPSDSTITLQFSAHVREGARLEVESTGELLYVWDWNADTLTATVERGFDGTLAADIAAGDIVRVNPRWTHVIEEVADELASLPGDGLVRMKVATFTDLDWDDDLQGIDVTGIRAEMLGGVYGVEYSFAGQRRWADGFRLDESVLWVNFCEAEEYRVHYWAGFDAPTSAADDLADLGLRESAHDVVAYGVAFRLLAGRATDRIDHETYNGARATEDVPAEMPSAVARALASTRATRLAAELARQQAEYPARSDMPPRRGDRWG